MVTHDLTPTQDLCMEVLAARHRLGHTEWPFDTRLAPAIRALEDKGLVSSRSGIVEKTVLVRLTDAGREHSLSPTYKPEPGPLLAALAEAGTLTEEWATPTIAGVLPLRGAYRRYVTAWRDTDGY